MPFKLKSNLKDENCDLCTCGGEGERRRALSVRVVYFGERKHEQSSESRKLVTCSQGTESYLLWLESRFQRCLGGGVQSDQSAQAETDLGFFSFGQLRCLFWRSEEHTSEL